MPLIAVKNIWLNFVFIVKQELYSMTIHTTQQIKNNSYILKQNLLYNRAKLKWIQDTFWKYKGRFREGVEPACDPSKIWKAWVKTNCAVHKLNWLRSFFRNIVRMVLSLEVHELGLEPLSASNDEQFSIKVKKTHYNLIKPSVKYTWFIAGLCQLKSN